MTTPVQISNLALMESGSRIPLTSFDNSPQGVVAATFYTPKTRALLRGANWDFARAQVTLAVWKQAIVNGATSSNPPPQPWQYSYIWPTDCLKARFVIPTYITSPAGTPLTTAPNALMPRLDVLTSVPFVPGTDFDQNGNPIRVILTNLPNAQLVYTRDLSQFPDTWDPLFLNAETAYLASYFINALTRNAAQYKDQVAIATSLIAQARVASANEGINTTDHLPDWIRARWGGNAGYTQPGQVAGVGYESVLFSCGLSF